MKKNKTLTALNVIIISAVFVLNYFYQSNGFDFTLKCICSSGFALLGLINLFYALNTKQSDKSFFILMASALVLAMLGDVLIAYNFILGAAVFALGHIFFTAAYCLLEKIRKSDLITSAVLFSGSTAFLLFFPFFTFDPPILRVVCIVYALIISLMLGKAAGNFLRQRTLVTGIIFIGSILFFFSDLMLVLHRFAGLWSWTNEACMGTYYPALCLLALSMHVKSAKSLRIKTK